MKKTLKVGFVSIAALTLVACGNKKEKKDEAKKEITIGVNAEMPSMDTSKATDTISFTAMNHIYEGLYRQDAKHEAQPAIAKEKANVSKDGLTYTFKLRKDAKWQNGDPVTAKDFVYGWQRTVDPKTASEYAYMYESVKNAKEITAGEKPKEELGIKAVNDYELKVTLATPTPYFGSLMAFPSFFPQNEKFVEKSGKKYGTSSEYVLSNGPFTLEKWDGTGLTWSYVKNNKYWAKKEIKLDKIHNRVMKESTVALDMFQSKKADDVSLTGEIARQKVNDPSFIAVKEARTTYLEFNQEKVEALKNKKIRQAISMVINNKEVAKNVLGDGSVASTGLVPSGLAKDPIEKEDFAKAEPDYTKTDIKKAKKLWAEGLKELGQDSLKLDLLADDVEASKKVAEYLQGTLEKNLAGLKVEVTAVPFKVRLDRSTKGDFEIVLGGWGADFADPLTFLDLFVTGNAYNRGKWSNKEYDELIEKSKTSEANDSAKRWPTLHKAQKVLMDDYGTYPIYQRAEAHLRNQKLKGVMNHPTGAKVDMSRAYLAK